ncbi:MAG: hypothetical protein IKR81_01405, partial [Victivallales bacterium]|nr:hypothetical protein [Victivallales bacterium]
FRVVRFSLSMHNTLTFFKPGAQEHNDMAMTRILIVIRNVLMIESMKCILTMFAYLLFLGTGWTPVIARSITFASDTIFKD